MLSESIAERMREKQSKCRVEQVYIRYAALAHYERQAQLPFSISTAQRTGDTATRLILDNWTRDPLRSIGVWACNLLSDEYLQLSLYPEQKEAQHQGDLESAMQDIRPLRALRDPARQYGCGPSALPPRHQRSCITADGGIIS